MHIALLPTVSPPSHTELAKCGDGYCHNGEQAVLKAFVCVVIPETRYQLYRAISI